jgi:hypothetical protein
MFLKTVYTLISPSTISIERKTQRLPKALRFYIFLQYTNPNNPEFLLFYYFLKRKISHFSISQRKLSIEHQEVVIKEPKGLVLKEQKQLEQAVKEEPEENIFNEIDVNNL